MFSNFFLSRSGYEIRWKKVVDSDRPHLTTWRMRIAHWTSKITNTPSECAISFPFPLQQWLHECAAVLRYIYIASLVLF